MRSAQRLAEHGTFDGFADAASGKELNLLFKDNFARLFDTILLVASYASGTMARTLFDP